MLRYGTFPLQVRVAASQSFFRFVFFKCESIAWDVKVMSL